MYPDEVERMECTFFEDIQKKTCGPIEENEET